ncbi:mRNA splicing factor Cwf21 domain - like 4 [Theobroma cacao]|uniref:CWF21 domain-containing protein n=1 Tax=Theobroma cacao TaxID=3641 RepID=A0A061GRV0_THECC|nr:Uncharacterized protein TCM_037256 [Theobroma cacao]WRX34663.1 mRNA splicing factor Cwf21 domain - like 4 [Theobroma cacao]
MAENASRLGADQGTISWKPDKDLLEHDRERRIEVKLVMLEDELVDQAYPSCEVGGGQEGFGSQGKWRIGSFEQQASVAYSGFLDVEMTDKRKEN